MKGFLDCSVVLPPLEVGGEGLQHSVTQLQPEMLEGREEKQSSFQQDEGQLGTKDRRQQHFPSFISDFYRSDSLVSPKTSVNEPLRRSGRLFGGLVQDVTRRYPQYLSDLQDALNPQCLAAIIFIYFAALSPAITFGGLLGKSLTVFTRLSVFCFFFFNVVVFLVLQEKKPKV